MTTTVQQTTEIIGGREYPLTITRQTGLQEIQVDGEAVAVTSVTLYDSPLGRSRCFTRARPPAPAGEREAVLRQIRETATRAMVEQGIW